eukprot:TRINITY_DN945_c0_g1_i2.p1 TRINITY_DN945_c0_g1~~TRINITY_DN945_c0_g1_i2.p1  ORF type:complete len:246 (+),score=1.61 TRINITY_DN945_c0_g1_i2:244-981(+)
MRSTPHTPLRHCSPPQDSRTPCLFHNMLSYRIAVLVGLLASCSASCQDPWCPRGCPVASNSSYFTMELPARCFAADTTANVTVFRDWDRCRSGIAEVNATGACVDASAGSDYVTAACTGRGQCDLSVSMRMDSVFCDCEPARTCLERVCGPNRVPSVHLCQPPTKNCEYMPECDSYCRVIPEHGMPVWACVLIAVGVATFVGFIIMVLRERCAKKVLDSKPELWLFSHQEGHSVRQAPVPASHRD